MRHRLWVAVLVALAAGASAASLARWLAWDEDGRRTFPLEAHGEVPNFSLIERSGRPVRLSDLAGRAWIVDFVFTNCTGPCPLLTRQMSNLQRPLAGFSDVLLVSITVDPERDTPGVLSDYAQQYGAEGERWLFLTGKKEAVYTLIREGFKLVVEEGGGSGPHQMIHSVRFALVDGEGRVRSYYDGTDPELAQNILPDVRALLREDG